MLRKSPVRTPALLAANRRNALKSTGPRTVAGRARVALNALKHGRHARRLHARLLKSNDWERAALYRRIRSVVLAAFAPSDPAQYRDCQRMAAEVWCHLEVLWRAGGTKPESPLLSEANLLRVPESFNKLSADSGRDWPAMTTGGRPASRRRVASIRSRRRRLGLTFWVQRRRFWTPGRLGRVLWADDDLPDEAVPDRPLGAEWENAVRYRIYRLGQPVPEERLRSKQDHDRGHHHWLARLPAIFRRLSGIRLKQFTASSAEGPQ